MSRIFKIFSKQGLITYTDLKKILTELIGYSLTDN
jgi:Ca2+-binding EF-hand superfamily protein